MLIRIVDHFRNNPKRIDKLIAIKGLPKEWMFRETNEGLELKKPWQADIDANIPHDIRSLCEPIYVNFRYPPATPGGKEIIDHRQVMGVKIDYNSEPGREMWDQVERYVEETVPRHERVPLPVLCAKDERSPFETYLARRTPTGSLELISSPVPVIDLDKYTEVRYDLPPVASHASTVSVPPVAASAPQSSSETSAPSTEPQAAASFICETCSAEFTKAQALRMHKLHHRNKEKVAS